MRWQDVFVIGLVLAAAIIAGWLQIIPQKVTVAVFTAVTGYFVARTALTKRDQKKLEEGEKLAREDGAPEAHDGQEQSARIHVKPQRSGRIVEVEADGSVTIGPDSQPQPADHEPEPFSETDGDRTPPEAPRPTGTDDEEPGD